MHPFVLGDPACGNLNNRAALLTLLGDLPPTPVATDAELLGFIDCHERMVAASVTSTCTCSHRRRSLPRPACGPATGVFGTSLSI
jgi:hypothetical protein